MSVRTNLLAAQGALSTGAITLYTCPTNRVAIIKDVRVAAPVGGATSITLSLLRTDGGGNRVWRVESAPANAVYVLTDWFLVLEPGNALQINVAGNTGAAATVSGALLAGTPE